MFVTLRPDLFELIISLKGTLTDLPHNLPEMTKRTTTNKK